MSITIIAVGKLKESFWKEACAEYLKRLRIYSTIVVKEIDDKDPAKVGGVSAALEKEGVSILAAIPDRCHVVLLAIDGKALSSEGFSDHLEALALAGKSNLAFIIGGSEGVSALVRARADEALSFGSITLPHNLARVVVLEQLYRAFKISRNEPYHK